METTEMVRTPNKHLLIAKRTLSPNGNSKISLRDGRFNLRKSANWSDFEDDEISDLRRIGAKFATSLGYTVEAVAEINTELNAIIVTEFVKLNEATPATCQTWRNQQYAGVVAE